jgi:hypothetical protein
MGRIRLSRPVRARLGYLFGLILVSVGLFLALGLGWALVAAGVGVCAGFVWLYDVGEPETMPEIAGGEW